MVTTIVGRNLTHQTQQSTRNSWGFRYFWILA